MRKQSPLRVLIVDDELAGAQSLSLVVAGMGHEVLASDSASAISQLDRFAPDVVLVDLESPGLAGLEICHAIRADPHHWHLWVVAMSGEGDLGTVETSGAVGFDVGIPKPVNATRLQKLLAQFCLIVGRE